jgi:hypothetical protein
LPNPLGFSVPRLLIGEGAMSGVGPGALTHVCGAPVAHLLLLFESLEASG